MIGRNWRVPLGVLLSLNEHLGRGRALAILTVASIATSVAMATGLDMSSRSVQAQMERTADAIAGAAQVEVSGGSLGIPEHLLAIVQGTPGVAAASPIVQITLKLPDRNFPLHVLGIDLTADQQVRPYSVMQDGLRVQDPLRLMVRPDAVIVTEALARRLQRREGDSFRARSRNRQHDLRIEGILREEGVAGAFGGQVALMDVYSLQTLIGREGWLDRIDVVPKEDVDLKALIAEIRTRTAGLATVRETSLRTSVVGRAVGTLRLGILLISGAGTVVASLVAYATMARSVDRRLSNLLLLRTVGLESNRVRRMIYGESLLFSLLGLGVGLPGGLFLSKWFIILISLFSENLEGLEILTHDPSAETLGIGLAVGVGVSVAGGVHPAHRATARFPIDPPSPGDTSTAVVSWQSALKVLGTVVLISASLWNGDCSLPPIARLLLLFVVGIGGIVGLAPALLQFVLRAAPLLERLLPSIGHLVGTALAARPRSTAVSLGAMAAVIAMLSGTMIVIESLTKSLTDWIGDSDEVWVTAGDILQGANRELIAPDVVEIIRTTPGVLAVDEQFSQDFVIPFRGEEVGIGAVSMSTIAQYGELSTIGQSSSEVARAVANGEIAVSEAFADHFGVSVGDFVDLNTPKGVRWFKVAGIIRSYWGPEGSLLFDMATFDGLWSRSGSTGVVLWTDSNREQILEDVRRRVGDRQGLFFTYGAQLKGIVRAYVAQFTDLFYLIAGFALLLGALSVMNLLIALVTERRRELALLRAGGASPMHLVVLVIVDGLVVSIGASIVGIAIGFACSFPMCDVLRQAFGWHVDQSVGIRGLALLVVGACWLAFVASIQPAWDARRTLATDVFSPE